MKPLLENFPIRRMASFLAILAVVGSQLFFLFAPRFGPDPYREKERRALLRALADNPTPETKAAYHEERILEDRHHAIVMYSAVGFFCLIDAVLLYVYWRCWVRRPAPIV